MRLRLVAAGAFLLLSSFLVLDAQKDRESQSPSPNPSASPSPQHSITPPLHPSSSASPSTTPSLQHSSSASPATAPFEKRLANAKSVKVTTSILGLELGSTVKQARAKLDKLSDPAHPPKEEGGDKEEGEGEKEEGHKVLWQLAKTDYAFIFVKADDKDRITYINGTLRPGKEIPFDKIGDTKKAPVQDNSAIAWDVLRPGHPLFRVVAKGAERKATNITIFVVKRPGVGAKD